MCLKVKNIDEEDLRKAFYEFEDIESEMAEWEEKNGAIEFSENLDEKMIKMIREFESIEDKTNKKQKKSKYIRIAAMLMLCVGVGMMAMTMSVDAFRIKIFDFLIEDHSEYIDVNIVEKGDLPPEIKKMFPKDWDSVFYPMEMPEGYELVEAYDGIGKGVYFLNKEKNISIDIFYSLIGESNLMVDSENAKVGETEVNGNSAVYTEKDGNIILIWAESGYEFCQIAYEMKIKKAVEIAESIAYVKLK